MALPPYLYPSNFTNSTGNFTSATDIGSYFQYVQYISSGWFAYAVLVIIFIIAMGTGIMTGTRKSLAAASFITFVFSVLFWRLEMINPVIMFVLLAGIIIGVIGTKEGSHM